MAFLLIPLSLMPLAFATILVGFGNQLQNWLAVHTIYELRGAVLLFWIWGRWSIGSAPTIAHRRNRSKGIIAFIAALTLGVGITIRFA